MNKRIISILLLAALCITVVSCGQEAQNPVTTDSSSDTSAEVIEPVTPKFPSLPDDLDFGGETLNILIREDSGAGSHLWKNEFYVEESTGDVVSDAVYQRNLDVSSFLNLDLNYISIPGDWGNMNSFITTVRSSIQSGESAYDVMASYQYYTPTFAVEGMLKNIAELPYVDWSQPWWPDDLMNSLMVNNRLYFVTGDIALSVFRDSIVTFFNSDLAEDFDLDMYQIVSDGKWTADMANSITKQVCSDLNGDGKMELGVDRFGYINYPAGQYLAAFGARTTVIGDDGVPAFNLSDERFISGVEKLWALLFDNEGGVDHTRSSDYAKQNDLDALFMNDQCFFYVNSLSYSDKFRSMRSDFGIIPIFKLNEEQDTYYTGPGDSYTVMSVPIDSDKDEAAGAYLEAMACLGRNLVREAYFSIALKNKITRDDESFKMLEMITSNVVYTFDKMYSSVIGNVGNIMRVMTDSNTTGWSSYVASNIDAWQTKLDSLLEFFDITE